jgi:hypothetical protein
MASSLGKIPTTFVRRLTSLFSRSSGLVPHAASAKLTKPIRYQSAAAGHQQASLCNGRASRAAFPSRDEVYQSDLPGARSRIFIPLGKA